MSATLTRNMEAPLDEFERTHTAVDILAAVSTGPKGRPRKLKLAPGSEVVTDGLGFWRVLGEGPYSHWAPEAGQFHAAVLTGARDYSSSKRSGLRYPRAAPATSTMCAAWAPTR